MMMMVHQFSMLDALKITNFFLESTTISKTHEKKLVKKKLLHLIY